MESSEAPPNDVKRIRQYDIKPTQGSQQINSTEINSTHVRNRLMESVNVTTSSYHGIRLPVLMLTWFQAVKNKVSVCC